MSNFDIEAKNLVNAIKRMMNQNKPNTMIYGTVKTIDPLSVDIGNGITLPKEFLFLGQNCRPHKVTIPHNHLINAIESGKTKGVITTSISAGVATDVQQTTGTYDVKTQKITRNDEKGIDERELQTETKSNIDLGGASLSMAIDVSTSPVSTNAGAGTVTKTIDLSTFTPTDNGHEHIIPEHSTQDVHFPDTDYEESVTIEIYPRLKVGDTVLMFAFNDYQKYYIAERIEGDEE